MERIATGVRGLDGLLQGGYPRGDLILICGGPGTGKTTIAIQFLLSRLPKDKGKSILVTLEESPNELRRRMSSLDLDLEKAENHGDLSILDASMSRIGLPSSEPSGSILPKEFTIDQLAARLFKFKPEPRRFVFDSLSAFEFERISDESIRKSIHKLFRLIRSLGCTSIFTSETQSGSSGSSRYGVEEYLADGLIQVRTEEIDGQLRRALLVHKMRGTNHSLEWHKFQIGNGGAALIEKE